MPTKTVNLRNVPDDLVRQAKAHAALSGLSLKDFVIQAIEKAVEQPLPAFAGSSAVNMLSVSKRKTKKRK